MEWTREKTLLLIGEYRQRRGLWDMTCDEYRKKDVKQRLLNEVSDVLGGNIPIPELEKKFHTLRTQYHREINRMKRKEPYNSKWFGFKNLNFLSSPYACRSTKGRLKAELQTPENATVQKYPLGEVNATDSNNMNEEYIITPRKSHASSAQELEKLIEETTKDADDIDEEEPGDVDDDVDTKPKLRKELAGGTYVHMNEEDTESLETHTHQQHHHHNQQQQQQQQHHSQSLMELHHTSNAVEAVSFQASESGELHYQSSGAGNAGGGGASSSSSSVHVMPTRIIKIQRRDTTGQPENGYFDEATTPQHQHQLHPPAPKRIYFDPNGSHSTTILSASTLAAATQNGNASNVLTSSGTTVTAGTLRLPRVNAIVNSTSTLSPPKPASSPIPPAPAISGTLRDEFSTYGEYVANEMRAIGNREVLIALKHKINTAIFEANMAELQK
ncbi:rho GTPase-activating protein gacF [Drosophila grimshawi]|uniref:GH18541 n=1 Tax=Drosophila grimshawi TaxID=7222 RepID=B4JS94_DROGR|nr:rho GTPase-activating protein gacF [Drosophila grimshawi]EDV94634.1 GH18541 [Drosophila grimshawi]